jgi:aspartate kinase
MGNIQVFKFGGASVKDPEHIANVAHIINQNSNNKLAIVVSAIGKSTNAMEEIVNAYFHQENRTQDLLNQIKLKHLRIAQECGINDEHALCDIMDTFVEVDWIIEDQVHDSYDYIYDQVVSVGEIVSTKIIYYYLLNRKVNVAWLDIRGVLFTDQIHREANVDWEHSTHRIKKEIDQLLTRYDCVITQGFIGSTRDNQTTTLGREGSDYSAAILSYCLDAESMHIWKDVPGVLTGDPTIFENVIKIDRMSYQEAIEMTYYGAKVIHPKTIKPIQNKSIPLFVRPYNQPNSMGTRIDGDNVLSYPPIIVVESNQCLVHISVKDFSFVAEHHMSNIFRIFSELRIKVNMMRNTAISFSLCVSDDKDKLDQLLEKLGDTFLIVIDHGLELITIRHYQEPTIETLKEGKIVLFEERLNQMMQMVVKDTPQVVRK